MHKYSINVAEDLNVVPKKQFFKTISSESDASQRLNYKEELFATKLY